MDIVAVLTKVAKEQQQTIERQNAFIKNLSEQLAALKSRVVKIENKDISALR